MTQHLQPDLYPKVDDEATIVLTYPGLDLDEIEGREFRPAEAVRDEFGLSPDQLSEALQISNLVKPGQSRVALVDVTPVNRTRNFHNFSLETPEYYDDLYLRLTSQDRAPLSRRLYRVRAPDDSEYWVLTRGR